MRNKMHSRYCIVLLITILMIFVGCADKAKAEFQKGKELQQQSKYENAIAHANLYGPSVSSVKNVVSSYVYISVFRRTIINVLDDDLKNVIRVDTSWFRIDSFQGSYTVQKSGIEIKDITIKERFAYNEQQDYYPLKIAINYVVFDTDGSKRVGWESQVTKFFRVTFAKDKYDTWEMIDPNWHYHVFLID